MSEIKKLLLLGGSPQQVIAIKTAKKLGYYTIVCDYLRDNPGQFIADKFFLVSTTDKDKILEIALAERINGIIAYASDPAAPTAAYVAEKMGLPTNPYESVEILCNKDKFRRFLLNKGFAVPKVYDETESVKCFPILIKPVDSSGSKGITVVKKTEEMEEAKDFAMSFSRSKRIIIEDYVEKNHKYLIGGDIFVNDGEISIWGLLNCHRDFSLNPLVPVGKSYPVDLTKEQLKIAEATLKRMVDELGIKFGPMNVELIIDKNDKCYLIDVGPRAGGNMIPDLLGMVFGLDIVEICLKCAMGEKINIKTKKQNCYFATHNLHSRFGGRYKTIEFDEQISRHIVKKYLYKKEGDPIEPFQNASNALGIIFMKFDKKSDMELLDDICNHYEVIRL